MILLVVAGALDESDPYMAGRVILYTESGERVAAVVRTAEGESVDWPGNRE